MRHLLTFAIIAIAALSFSGCSGSADLQQAKEALAAQQVYLNEQREVAVAQRTQAETDGNLPAVAAANKTIQVISKIQPQLTKAQVVVESGINEDGTVNAAKMVQTASSFLPPPYGVIAGYVALGIGGLFANYKREQAVKAAASIVNSLDVLRIADPTVATAMAKNKQAMQAQLTPAAKAIVDNERLNA